MPCRLYNSRSCVRFLPVAAALLAFFTTSTASLRAQQLRIAAASDLQFALPELAADFEKQSGTTVALTFGSSGTFVSQIQNGAPFDLFFSADSAYANKLIETNFAEKQSFYIYGIGHLVLWLPKDSPLANQPLGWKILLDNRIRKIAIANPAHAPYGKAAVEALKHAGVYDQLQPKLVSGDNVSQAAQFAQSGAADVALISLSQAVAPALKDGLHWQVPAADYSPLEQAVVLLSASKEKTAAANFLAYLKSNAAKSILARFGFQLPANPPSPARP